MKLRFDKRVWVMLSVLLVSMSGTALAYEYSPMEMSRPNSAARAGRRLGRGVSNVLLGWVELPRGMEAVGHESGFSAGATWGVLQGAGAAFLRTAAGVVEVATFPVAGVFSKNDDPLVEPEFIL